MKHLAHAAAVAAVLLGVSSASAQDPYTTGNPVGIYVNGKLVSAANPFPVTGGTGGGSSGGGGAVTQSTGATSWSNSWLMQIGTASGANAAGNPLFAQITNLPATQSVQGVAGGTPVGVLDPNNAPFYGAVAITPGTAFTATRSIGYVITTAGSVTFTLSDASTLTIPLPVAGFTSLPFLVTKVTLGTGTAGSFWSLK